MKTAQDILATLEASPVKDIRNTLATLIGVRLATQPNLSLADAIAVASPLNLGEMDAFLALNRLEGAGLIRFYVKDGAIAPQEALQDRSQARSIKLVWALSEEDALKSPSL